MGNQLAQPQRFQPEHLQELPKVVYKHTLGRQCSPDLAEPRTATSSADTKLPSGGGRVLKTVLCIHDQAGLVVVKVRVLPSTSIG